MPDTTTYQFQPMKLEASSADFEDLNRIIDVVFGSDTTLYVSYSGNQGFTLTADPVLADKWLQMAHSTFEVNDDASSNIKGRVKAVFKELTLEQKRTMNPDATIHHSGPNLMGWSARTVLVTGQSGDSLVLRIVPAQAN